MKDIMKYYLQLITLVFCLFVSACSDDDEIQRLYSRICRK